MKLATALMFAGLLLACTPNTNQNSQAPVADAQTQEILLSNISDEASRQQVYQTLNEHLPKDSVDKVMSWISDYNTTIEHTGLIDGFSRTSNPSYNVAKIDELWQASQGDFVGTNCRINTFTLLKDTIHFDDTPANHTQMLFMDRRAINDGKLLNADETAQFNRLFSWVKTQASKDVQFHAKKMQEHFRGIEFDQNATMLSVVMHDNLDGDFLFIGHVGVLLPTKDGYLFIEKISFQEPYQAIKFNTKDQAYSYLLNKYAVDYNQPTAMPFIMENEKLVKWIDDKATVKSQ